MVDPAELIGRDLHGYAIARLLGSGGFGWVYQVHHRFLGDRALKVLYPWMAQDPAQRERFRREAISGDLLHHENIVPVHDLFEADGLLCIVMMLVDPPTTLASILAARRVLPPPEAAGIARQVASALDHAHGNGVVHRDVTPNNVLVRPDGTVMLSDFGIAQLALAGQATKGSRIAGTPAFMSPEQLTGSDVDRRSDVFQFALVIHQMVSGHARTGPLAPLPPATSINNSLPAGVDAVLQQGLAWQPENRVSEAGTLADSFAQCFGPMAATVVQIKPAWQEPTSAPASAGAVAELTTLPSFTPPALDSLPPPTLWQPAPAGEPRPTAERPRSPWGQLRRLASTPLMMFGLVALIAVALSITGIRWLVHAPQQRVAVAIPDDRRTGIPPVPAVTVTIFVSPTPTTAPSPPVVVPTAVAATALPPPPPPPTAKPAPPPTPPPKPPSVLSADRVLHTDDKLVSFDDAHVLVMQGDGNLVLYRTGGRALWASNTSGNPGALCVMQKDGNLVVYSTSVRALWASNTSGHPGAVAVLQDDGNFVVYAAGGTPLWATNTVD